MVFTYDPKRHIITKLKSGKQGLVGLILDKSDKTIKVYKFSTTLNQLGTHEYKIMKSLSTINQISPFFTQAYELVNCNINSNFEEANNPFELTTKYKYNVDVCISEYVGNARKLTSFLRHPKQVNDNIIISLLKQIFVGLLMAQKNVNFSHYDLHSENVLVQKCSYNDVYVWYDHTLKRGYVVPSLGYIPRIIDYGFSYSDNLQGTSITSPLSFMKEGYFSVHPDQFADLRILGVCVLDDLYHYRRDGYLFIYLKRIIKNMFKDTNIDWESGWFVDNRSCAEKFLYENIATHEEYHKYFESPTIDEHFYSMLGCLQLLVNTPLDTDPLPDKSMPELFQEFMYGFKEFYKHFIKLEHLFEENKEQENVYVSNPDMGLYIIRSTVECILATRSNYLNPDPVISKGAVRTFQNTLYDIIRINKKLHLPKINYAKYMVSIYVMVNAFQSLLYREYEYRKWYVCKQYATTGIESSNEVFQIIDTFLNIPYHYTPETRFILMNEEKGVSEIYHLTKEECLKLNENQDMIPDLVHTMLSKTEPSVSTNETKSIQQILFSEGQSLDSPNKKVEMNKWSPSDSESEDSDDEEYNIKYDWSIPEPEIVNVEKKTIHFYVESSSSESSCDESDEIQN